jgi:hypothetical protein
MNPILLDTCAVLWLGNGDPVSSAATDALNECNSTGTTVYVSVQCVGNRQSGRTQSHTFAPNTATMV